MSLTGATASKHEALVANNWYRVLLVQNKAAIPVYYYSNGLTSNLVQYASSYLLDANWCTYQLVLGDPYRWKVDDIRDIVHFRHLELLEIVADSRECSRRPLLLTSLATLA